MASVKLTTEQLAHVRAELEEKVGAEKASAVSDERTLQRFFRATGGHVQHTIKRLAHTAQWRHEHNPEHLDCSACLADPSSHYMHM